MLFLLENLSTDPNLHQFLLLSFGSSDFWAAGYMLQYVFVLSSWELVTPWPVLSWP